MQLGLEVAIILAMGQQLLAVARSLSDRAARAAGQFCLALAFTAALSTGALAEPKLHAKANADGSLSVQLRDEATGQKMDTTLTAARTREFTAYLTKHGLVADAKPSATVAVPEPKPGCGFGDFFGGRC